MMNDVEFHPFLQVFRSAYGLPPMASSEVTVDYEGFIAEDDHASQTFLRSHRGDKKIGILRTVRMDLSTKND